MSLVTLGNLIAEMFDHVEPALLDFIDQADTNQSQFQFVDAISIVTTNRELVEQVFREEISRGFTEFSKQQPISYSTALLDSQREETSGLELVDDNDLNQQLSLRNMIENVNNDCFQELHALRQRLSMINGGNKLEEKDIPAGPVHIASAIQKAAAEFGFDSGILLIMYALFNKFVMRKLSGLYSEFNEKLVEAGLFPNLKFEAPRNPNKPQPQPQDEITGEEEPWLAQGQPTTGYPAQTQPDSAGHRREAGQNQYAPPGEQQMHAEGTGGLSLGEEVFASIRDLLTDRRRQDPRYSQHPDVNPDVPRRPMVDTPGLVTAITDIQPPQSAGFLPVVEKESERPAVVPIGEELLSKVKEQLAIEREQLFREVDRNTIPSADLDTIELVGMLFEHVLNEDELPNIAKALISHLHTPYLKVAIIDHHFLIDTRHVARRLLNTMMDAGRQWIDEDDLRRGIYYPMQEAVNLILSDFRDNIEIFHVILERLNKQINDLAQKSKVVEARAQEAAKGRERLENARNRGQQIILKQIGKRRFPVAVERFINRAWLDKMILMLLRDPNIEVTSEWQEVTKVIDDVIWICDSREKPEMRASLKASLPELKRRIEDGLSSMGDFHQPDLQALFELLTSFLDPGAPVKEIPPDDHRPETQPEWQRPKKAQTEKPTRPLSGPDKEMADLLRKLKFGTWFEIEDKKGRTHQLKLSWYSPVTRNYMFVDRSGVQALVTPLDILARQLSRGKAKIMERSELPFVDRTLDTVLNLLKKPFGK